jgi:hypothetical protein
LGLANRAYLLEGGQLRFSGLARELRDKPELLRSAYLLRGSQEAPTAPPNRAGQAATTGKPAG